MQDGTYGQEGFGFPTEEPSNIPADHPLRRLFSVLVERAFLNSVGVYDSEITDYLARVLTNFTHVRNLYKIRNLAGRPLEEVADMLLEADINMNATSFNREREVHRHIGDFTLFWTGIYPDALPRLQSGMRKDQLIDYVRQGKSSYAIAAQHDYGAYRSEARVLQQLSEEFETCMVGLHFVRHEMDHLPNQRFSG
jgi:hypothetical protein